MIKSGSAPRFPFLSAKIQTLVRLKLFLGLIVTVLVTVAATPPDQQIPDEQYIHIMDLIDRGDALREAGKTDLAKAKYKEAQKDLIYFKAANPLFNPKTVEYRLTELAGRVDARAPVSFTNAPAAAPKANLEAESKATVKLIDAGAEPRKALRFHVTQGDKQSVTMTIKITTELPAAAGAPAGGGMKIPGLVIPMDVTIQNVSTTGEITYEGVLGDASVMDDTNAAPMVVQAMKKGLAGMKGITATGIETDRGISKKVEFKGAAANDPQVRQFGDMIKQAMADPGLPLPEEAVGAGAKWEVSLPSKTHGVTTEQKATFQLVSVDGDHLSSTYEMNISGAQKAPATGMQMSVQITGSVTADLSKLFAPLNTMNAASDISTVGKSDVNITIEAK